MGPLKLGRIHFRASVLTTPFIELPQDTSATVVTRDDLRDCPVAVIPGHPDANQNTQTIQKLNGLVRYASFTETRYLVELRGSLSTYLAKFSAKRRHNLLRTVKKFTELSEGKLDCREFRSGSEMLEFQRIAVEISEKTYKKNIGWGFQSSEKFGQELVEAAAVGAVRGYVLVLQGSTGRLCFLPYPELHRLLHPYQLRPAVQRSSPGTVLLYLLIERLFEEGRFDLPRFSRRSVLAIQAGFLDRATPVCNSVLFSPTLPNMALIFAHLTVRKLESLGVRAKAMLAGIRRGQKN